VQLEDVDSVRASLTARFIPNGLEIVVLGRGERFVVEGSRGWADEVRRAKELKASGAV
jgi:hypothetical protein